MNTLMNMNPWNFLEELLDVDSRAFRSMRQRAAGRFPPVNVYMDDNAILLDVELPGKTAKDVELTLDTQAVTIASKPKEGDEKGECAWQRRLELPFRVDAHKANAKFTNGILRIELPKMEEEAKRHIEISA